MALCEFSDKVVGGITAGMIFNNPGGGTSKVFRINNERIVYQRGHSEIILKIDMLYRAYEAFKGCDVTTRMLKQFDNSFDSAAHSPAGHNCNCTFAFLVLRELGLAAGIVPKRPMYQYWF